MIRGTAILFQTNQTVTIIEDVDHSVYEQLKSHFGTCELENKMVDFGAVSPVFWHEDEVDWDYGY